MPGLDSDDRGPIWEGLGWGLTAVAAVCVSLRLTSRTAFGNKLGLDDFFTVICLTVNIAAAIATTMAVQAGAGKHIMLIEFTQIPDVMRRIVILNCIIVWTFSLPKFAIIALLERLLRLDKWTRIAFWSVAAITQCGITALSVIWFTRCTPVEANWLPTLPGASCGSLKPMEGLSWATSTISAVLDLFFALYPIPFVMRLQMSLRRRIGISVSLGLGGIACAVAVYKITTINGVVEQLPIDPTYAIVPLDLFAHVEANILIICASLPTLGPLIRWVSDKQPFSTKGDSNWKSGGDSSRDRFARSNKRYKIHDDGNTTFDDNGIPLVQGSLDNGAISETRSDKANFGIYKSVQVDVSRV